MARVVFPALLLVAALVSGPAVANSDGLTILDGFSDFGAPEQTTVSRPMDAISEKLSAFPETLGEGRPSLEMKSSLTEAGALMIDMVEGGLLDDSVSAVNRRYIVEQADDGTFRITAYGFRQKCARGEAPGEWTDKPCP